MQVEESIRSRVSANGSSDQSSSVGSSATTIAHAAAIRSSANSRSPMRYVTATTSALSSTWRVRTVADGVTITTATRTRMAIAAVTALHNERTRAISRASSQIRGGSHPRGTRDIRYGRFSTGTSPPSPHCRDIEVVKPVLDSRMYQMLPPGR